jgi:AbrB family looped-hinge helix DNA binding protein
MSMMTARISAKGQITLPGEVRQALHVKAGERLLILVEEDSVVLRPLSASSAKDLAGSLCEYALGRRASAARSVTKKQVSRAVAEEG